MATINQHALRELRPLTDEERLEAAERARSVILKANSDKPRREQFADISISRYPAWFTRLVAVFMVIVFVAAAMPSLFRLYTAGSEYFRHGIDNAFLGSIVGISTFLLAEFLIILSTISARVYFEGRARFVFVIPICLGLAMALVGNYVVAQPTDLFGWLETLSPPFAVLFLAIIGERLVLDAIESRHANERAYQQALVDWQAANHDPENSPRWRGAYANALKAMLRDVNSKDRGATARKELMGNLTAGDWRVLVIREMRADSWFEDVSLHEPAPVPTNQDNGHQDNPTGNFTSPVAVNGYSTANGHRPDGNQD